MFFHVLLLWGRAGLAAEADSSPSRYLQGPARQALWHVLDREARRYDPAARLVVVEKIREADYTRLAGRRGHPTRDSLDYAALLLEANEPDSRRRAGEIIAKVISLQDADPGSLTYGVWPWYAEEPLHKMPIPDHNWAAFLGKTLLHILIHHEAQLTPDLRRDVRESILRACTAIRRRPLHVGYTNIAAMSSYVTVVAGERLGEPHVLKYGQWLFDQWYDYTMEHGSFTEFNSPTYTRVTLESVSKMLADFRDPHRRAKVETINRMLWTHLARRFHEPTWQWAGPYSRAYSYLEHPGFAHWIQRAMDGAVRLVPPEVLGPDVRDWRHPYRAPADLAHYFHPLTEPRQEIEVFVKAGNALPNGLGLKGGRTTQIPIVGTTYLHPHFALGTVNACDFWEQHGNLVAHWGNRREPAFLVMRCRNEEHGFCSAAIASVQLQGDALAAVVFMTDFGNRFMDLDRLPNQTLKTTSLRVEFEFGGHLGEARWPDRCDPAAPFVMTDRGVRLSIAYLGGGFADEPSSWELTRPPGRIVLQRHLYKGPRRAFRLPDLTQAVGLFAVSLGEDAPVNQEPQRPRVVLKDDRYHVAWEVHGGRLVLEGAIRPLPFAELQKQTVATINAKPPWEYATSSRPASSH